MRGIFVLGLSLVLGALDGARAQDTIIFELQGTVYDRLSATPIAGAGIEVTGTDNTSFSALTDEQGYFSFGANGQQRFINANTSYVIRVTAKYHLVVNDQLSTVGLVESTTFAKEYYLSKVIIEHTAPEIRFERRSARFDEEAPDAEIIVTTLNETPGLVLELRGHCDAEEDTTFAIARAEALMHYLTKRGIDAQRLRVRSFGARELRITSAEMKDMTQAEVQQAHAVNRRVDLKILATDYHK